jgi:type I restriction enzyme S subunit
MIAENNCPLPKGWVLKIVEDLYNVVGGGTPSTTVPEYWEGEIPWITSADIHDLKEIRPRRYINKDAITHSATNLVPAGCLIVVTRVSLGKVALTTFPLSFSQDSQALIAKNNNVLPEFALYYLSQAVQAFKYQGRGTTISGVTKKQLKELPFPLPPIPEQERIVRRIEELFSQLDAGVAGLKRAQTALNRYKASVLKAACEGRLIGSGKAKDLTNLDEESSRHIPICSNRSLPESWLLKTVEDLYDVVGGGTPSTSIPEYWEGDIPWITSADIHDLKDIRPRKNITKDAISKSATNLVPSGSLIVVTRVSLGKVALPSFPLCFSQDSQALIPKDKSVLPEYALYYLSQAVQIFKSQGRGTTILGVTKKQLKELPFPLPPLAEQRLIVAEIERRLSMAQQVEAVVAASLARAMRLRQVMLRSAFEGRLV